MLAVEERALNGGACLELATRTRKRVLSEAIGILVLAWRATNDLYK